jgi:hypothetical protein
MEPQNPAERNYPSRCIVQRWGAEDFWVAAMFRRLGSAVFAVAALMPALAHSDNQGQQLMKKWAGSDRCSQLAYKAYPDYTAESLAKRDLEFKKCLAGGNLPPRDIPSPNKP